MRLLIVDDDPGFRQSLTLLLGSEGHEVVAEGSPTAALARAADDVFDVILCDVRMPEMDGLTFLARYQKAGGRALVLVMSAYGGEDAAIEAMKRGAYDYLPKPFRSDEVLLTLRKAAERERLRGRVATLEAELTRLTEVDVVADSPAMRRVMDLAARVAPHPTTVLLTGESGTGKEVVARAIHRMSPRHDGPFIGINCGAIPESLLESELFGHVRGAFTGAAADKPGLFEEADEGTLLLDEVGDLPLALQVKLLRVLQEGEIRRVGDAATRRVDVRVIAATARDPESDVQAGRFREDLFYRLNVVRIHLPPLRERPEDLDGLVTTLLARAAARSRRQVSITPEAVEALKRNPWPGNVRELDIAVVGGAVVGREGVIGAAGVGRSGAPGAGVGIKPPVRRSADPPVSLKAALAAAEADAVRQALAVTGGNRREAASLLGISLRSLFYKIRQHGLE